MNRPQRRIAMQRFMSLLAAVCAGVLLCAGAIVAPLVFIALSPDHVTAGRLAAQVFEISYWLTGGAAVLILLSHSISTRNEWVLVFGALLLAAVQLFSVVPGLLHHGQGWPLPMATLHGAAGLIHFVLMLVMLVLAWLMSRSNTAR